MEIGSFTKKKKQPQHPLEEKKWLENLTHPLIANEITTQIESANSPYVILSSALLLESGQKDLVDLIIVVDAPESLQLSRTILRDENSSDLVKKIMKSQLSREERLSQADIIIDNSHSLETLEINTRNIHKDLMRQAKNKQYN